MGNMKIHFLLTPIILLFTVIGCASQQGSYLVNKHQAQSSEANPIIYGYLYEYGTKDPVITSAVTLNKQIKSRVDASLGKYSFSVEPGKYRFDGIGIGYYPTKTKRIKVVEGDSVRIDFYLKVNDTPLHN
jgi:uncharacterized membrane protein